MKNIQRTLVEQWSVLATLTPREYAEFRDSLASASGSQSFQYRAIEFVLGNKNANLLSMFDDDPDAHALLSELLDAPTLYDAFLSLLARAGYAGAGPHLLPRA